MDEKVQRGRGGRGEERGSRDGSVDGMDAEGPTHPLMMCWRLFLPVSTTWFARKNNSIRNRSRGVRAGCNGLLLVVVGEVYPVCIAVARPAQLPAHTPCLPSECTFHFVKFPTKNFLKRGGEVTAR